MAFVVYVLEFPCIDMAQVSDSKFGQRLRRIEGRHNALVKELRQAFTRAERTEAGDCAIEGLRIVEEAIRSGLKFGAFFFRESAKNLADRLLPQIGSHVDTLLLPDKIFDGAVPSETPQGVAALVRLRDFSVDDVVERLQLGPVMVVVGSKIPEIGNDPAFCRSIRKRRNDSGGRNGEPFQYEGDSGFGWIGVSLAAGCRESCGGTGRHHGKASRAECAADRNLFAQGNGA